jgi:predicted Zn-dependent peptidase
MFEYVDKMNKVTAKELSNVAKVYLNFNQMNTVELLPQKIQ